MAKISFSEGWKSFLRWVKLVHSSSDEASAKRFYGGIGFLTCVILLYLVALGAISMKTADDLQSYWEFMLAISSSMIGLGTAETIFKAKYNKKEEQQ